MNLILCFIADGYLYGASEDTQADDPNFWRPCFIGEEDRNFTLVRVWVDPEIGDMLLAQGTSNQVYSDGYEAAGAVAVIDQEVVWKEGE